MLRKSQVNEYDCKRSGDDNFHGMELRGDDGSISKSGAYFHLQYMRVCECAG